MDNASHFSEQSTTGAPGVSIKYETVKPVTVDFRTGGNEDLYEYVKQYAKTHTNGKLSRAIIDIVRDHKNDGMSRSILMIQGNQVMSIG